MIHHFLTCYLNHDGSTKTQKIDGHEGIIVQGPKQNYNYQEIKTVISQSSFAERRQFGWEVKFTDDAGNYFSIFIRSSHIKTCNDTTRSDQTINEWIDYIYGRASEQIQLF
uniref:hypothetical protein n=1 Tax=Jeotgalibaca porci TaxID=1868793 RepID=UPI00359FA778